MEDVLEIVSLGRTTKSVEADTHLKSWRERVRDCRSCNGETAGDEWSVNKRNRESRLVFDKL